MVETEGKNWLDQSHCMEWSVFLPIIYVDMCLFVCLYLSFCPLHHWEESKIFMVVGIQLEPFSFYMTAEWHEYESQYF